MISPTPTTNADINYDNPVFTTGNHVFANNETTTPTMTAISTSFSSMVTSDSLPSLSEPTIMNLNVSSQTNLPLIGGKPLATMTKSSGGNAFTSKPSITQTPLIDKAFITKCVISSSTTATAPVTTKPYSATLYAKDLTAPPQSSRSQATYSNTPTKSSNKSESSLPATSTSSSSATPSHRRSWSFHSKYIHVVTCN